MYELNPAEGTAVYLLLTNEVPMSACGRFIDVHVMSDGSCKIDLFEFDHAHRGSIIAVEENGELSGAFLTEQLLQKISCGDVSEECFFRALDELNQTELVIHKSMIGLSEKCDSPLGEMWRIRKDSQSGYIDLRLVSLQSRYEDRSIAHFLTAAYCAYINDGYQEKTPAENAREYVTSHRRRSADRKAFSRRV